MKLFWIYSVAVGTTARRQNRKMNLRHVQSSAAHPVSLVLLRAAGGVRLHAVLILHRVSRLARVPHVVNKHQGLILHRLTYRQQQLGQLGNVSTWTAETYQVNYFCNSFSNADKQTTQTHFLPSSP